MQTHQEVKPMKTAKTPRRTFAARFPRFGEGTGRELDALIDHVEAIHQAADSALLDEPADIDPDSALEAVRQLWLDAGLSRKLLPRRVTHYAGENRLQIALGCQLHSRVWVALTRALWDRHPGLYGVAMLAESGAAASVVDDIPADCREGLFRRAVK